MAFATTTFKLDLTPGASRPVLYASQGDIGRPFMARCYWNGATWTATGNTVNIRGRKPDETVFDYTATVDGSTVTFETTEQMTIISGPVECELVFSNDGDIIASANFVLMVEDSPYNPDAPSESVVPGIEDLIEQTIGGDVSDEVDALITAHPELMLQDNAVTTAKIASGAVTEGKIASNAVTTGKLATGAVTSAKIDADFLQTIKNAYVTPEQFGAVGDGVTDDTVAINDMFSANAKMYFLSKTYKVTNITIANITNAVMFGGVLVTDPRIYADVENNQHNMLTISNCDNFTINGLRLESVNTTNAYPPSGFTHKSGALSSNVCGMRLYNCTNCSFNDIIIDNMLVGLFFDRNNETYNEIHNSNITINNIIMNKCLEGVHSTQANNLTINGMKFGTTDVPQDGYHGFYFEKHTKKVYINDLYASMPEDYASAFFDFADYNTWDASMFNQEIYLRNCIVSTPVLFAFRYRNKGLYADNCRFTMTKVVDANGTVYDYSRWFIVAESDKNSDAYPTCEFTNCEFLLAENVTIGYFKLDDKYIKVSFKSCNIFARITTICDVFFELCTVHDTAIHIIDTIEGSCTFLNCDIVCEHTTSAYYLSCRTTSFIIKFYNCRVVYTTQQFIYNGDADCAIAFYGCYFHSDYPNITIIQSGTGSRAVLVNTFLNNNLLTNT